jgi:hypothetical protein
MYLLYKNDILQHDPHPWQELAKKEKVNIISLSFYATLAYIRHFIFAGCYDNNPWYLVTNLAGHLALAGFYFLNAPLILNAPLNLLLGTRYRPALSSCDGGSPRLNILILAGLKHAPPLIES